MKPVRNIDGELIIYEYQIAGMLVILGADKAAEVVENLIAERDSYKREATEAKRRMEMIERTIG